VNTDTLAELRMAYDNLVALETRLRENPDQESSAIENVLKAYETWINRANKNQAGLLNSKETIVLHARRQNGHSLYSIAAILTHLNSNIGRLRARLNELSPTISVDTESFSFIMNSGLRDILVRDYQHLHKCLAAACWKPAIILAGGSIEAILLDALKRDPRRAMTCPSAPKWDDGNPMPLDKWPLASLIRVAADLHLVAGGVVGLSETVREYRNLIHPALEIRSDLKPEEHEANIALEVLKILIRDFSRPPAGQRGARPRGAV